MPQRITYDTGTKVDWFDDDVSNMLHKYTDASTKVDNDINFGKNKYSDCFCETYKFKQEKKSLMDAEYQPIIKINNLSQIEILNKKKEKSINTARKNNKSENIIKGIATKYDNKIKNLNRTTKTKKIILSLDKEQKNTINGWMKECIKIQNICVEKYNADNNFFDDGYMKTKIEIFDILKKIKKRKLVCPYDARTNEVKVFCSNLNSCNTNLENENIDHFVIKNKNTKKGQTIGIPKTAINTNGFYISYIGEIKSVKTFFNTSGIKLENINDSSLQYDKMKNKYFLLICYNDIKKEVAKREKFCVQDPGEAIFQTYFSENGYGYIGKNMRYKILNIEKKIKQTQSVISKGINRNGKNISNMWKLKKKIRGYYQDIYNYVEELHNKTALYLCKNYERIIIPKFQTQGMVRGPALNNRNNKISNEMKLEFENTENKLEYLKKTKIEEMYQLLNIKEGTKEMTEIEKILTEYKKITTIVIENNNRLIDIFKELNEEITEKAMNEKRIHIERIKKISKDLSKIRRNKIADYLSNTFGNAILKEYQKKMRKKYKLNGRVKFVLMRLRHYQFKQHLINKCDEYGCKFIEVTEEYTSKACTNCGRISSNFKNRIKKCRYCGNKINRDLNGARNITIKNIDTIIKL